MNASVPTGQKHRNCNGCAHCSAIYGNGWTPQWDGKPIESLRETRAFVECRLFGRVYLDRHWQQGEEQPIAFFPEGCPRTQLTLML